MTGPRSDDISFEHAGVDAKVDVGAIFNSLGNALREEGWLGIRCSDNNNRGSFLRQKQSTWVRVETGLQVDVAVTSELFPPPEAAFTDRSWNSEVRLLEVLQPGEVKIKCNIPPSWRPLLNSMRALAGRRWWHCPEEAAVYVASRQASAPPENSVHASLLLAQPPFIWIIRAAPTLRGANKMIHFFSFPEDLGNLMAEFVASVLWQVVMQNEWLILRALTDRHLTMARRLALSFYVVLTLRKCSNGPPFLPKSAAAVKDNPLAEDWHQLSYNEFTFPTYLRSFFQIVNLSHCKVFESLQGSSIVPYQAVVKRADWTQNKEIFLAAFNVAGLIYRRVLKTEKPRILDTVEPRPADSPTPSYEPEQCGKQPTQRIRVRNTFLEVSDSSDDHAVDGSPPKRGRSLSDLPLS